MWIRCRSVKNWKLVIQLNERKVSCEGYQKQIGSGAFFFFCALLAHYFLISNGQTRRESSILGKKPQKMFCSKKEKRTEVSDWWFSEVICLQMILLILLIEKKSRDTVFILLNSSSDRLSSGRAIASRLDLICCVPSYRERGSSPSHWGTAKTSWKSSNMIAKFCP